MTTPTTPKVKSACVRCKLKDDEEFVYTKGGNHTYCYDFLREAHNMYPQASPEKYDFEEGFLLTNSEFVNRMAAMEVAKRENQLKPEYKEQNVPLLYSYMVCYKKS